MGPLKNFNKEQVTLGAAALLAALVFGWQSARGGSGTAGAGGAGGDRTYGTPRLQVPEFVQPKVDHYLQGRNIWEPPITGRLPIPEIRHPEPRLDGPVLPPLRPSPNFEIFNRALLPGKDRVLPRALGVSTPPGLLPAAELEALKALKEPEAVGVPDRRKQLMRPTGEAIVHLKPPAKPIEGRVLLEKPDGTIMIEIVKGDSKQRREIKPDDIDRAHPGTEDGVERGWEYEKDYDRRSRRLKDTDVDGHVKLGRWCREQSGMLPEAARSFRTALETLRRKNDVSQKSREILFQLADTHRDLGDIDGAVAVVSEFLDSVRGGTQETGDLHLKLGDLFRAIGHFERAGQSYLAAALLEPARQAGRTMLARVQYEAGRDVDALDTLDQMAKALGKLEDEALLVQALCQLRQGNAAAAQASLAGVLAARPDHSEALNAAGVAHALLGQPEGPARFAAAIKANQYEIDAWLNLAVLYLAAGAAPEAEALYQAAAQRDPDSPTALAGLGLVQALKTQGKDTGGHLDRALAVRPGHYYSKYALGHLALQAGRAQEALDRFTESFRDESSYLPAYYDASLAYLALAREEQRAGQYGPAEQRAGRMERAASLRVNAETLLGSMRELDPTRAETYIALGCVYASQGRPSEALAALNQGATGAQPDPLVEYARGFVDYWYSGENRKQGIELAEGRFRGGSLMQPVTESDKDWIAACVDALKKVDDWKTKRVLFEDRFDNNQWSPTAAWLRVEAPNGPQMKAEGGRWAVSGVQGSGRSSRLTGLERRDIAGVEFLSVEAVLTWESLAGQEIGCSVFVSKPAGSGATEQAQGVHLVVTEDRVKGLRLGFGYGMAVRERGPDQLGAFTMALAAGTKSLRFKIERREAEARTWVFELFLWDEAKQDWKLAIEKAPPKVPHSGDNVPYILSLWGRSAVESQKVGFGIDDVRVLITTRR